MSVKPGVVGAGLLVAAIWAMQAPYVQSAEPAASPEAPQHLVSAEYRGCVIDLLSEGFTRAPGALAAAEQHYRAARALRPDDPQLDYAYGLVLLKQLKHSDAVDRFQQAAAADPPSLPAARAAIRELIRRKDYDRTLESLTRLADSVGEADAVAADVDAADRAETARWMGLAVGFLTGPHSTDTVRDRAAAADPGLAARLGLDYAVHYELGKQDVLVIEGRLQIEQETAEASAKLKQQAEAQQAAARRESYQARQEELLDTREKWDAWFADVSNELDSQLDQLGDRFDTLNRSVTSLIESIQAAQWDLRRLQTVVEMEQRRGNPNAGRIVGVPVAGTLEAQLLSRSQELSVCVNELSVALAQRDLTVKQAQGLLSQRAAAEQKYRDATGEVARKASRVQQWDARLKTAMTQAQTVPASSRRLRSVASRAQSFATYDPFDLDAEQQRLLQLYSGPMN